MSDKASNDVLLIDNDPSHAKIFEEAFVAVGDDPSRVEWARTLASGLERLADEEVWAIFVNLYLPDSRGLDTLKLLSITTDAPIVVVAGEDDEEICPCKLPLLLPEATMSDASFCISAVAWRQAPC